jgi:hypothetical protein
MRRHWRCSGRLPPELAVVDRPAPKPIALPPLAQHLREFAARRDAWLILARNLVPVAGIYAFDWRAGLTVFSYWFDGLTAVAAILAALVPRAVRVSSPKGRKHGRLRQVATGTLTWAFVFGIVGTPYWAVLVVLRESLLGPALRTELLHSPGLWLTFATMAAMHFRMAFRVGYDSMAEADLKQRVRWDLYLLALRAVAMFVLAGGIFASVLVPLMALLLAYMEIWPERALGLVFGDPKRLGELDPDES